MNEESLHWLGIFNNFAISNNNGVDRLEFSGLTGNPSPFPLCDYLRSTQVFDSQSLFLTKQGGGNGDGELGMRWYSPSLTRRRVLKILSARKFRVPLIFDESSKGFDNVHN